VPLIIVVVSTQNWMGVCPLSDVRFVKWIPTKWQLPHALWGRPPVRLPACLPRPRGPYGPMAPMSVHMDLYGPRWIHIGPVEKWSEGTFFKGALLPHLCTPIPSNMFSYAFVRNSASYAFWIALRTHSRASYAFWNTGSSMPFVCTIVHMNRAG